ncbi:MAG TPA: DUF1080 domain-containing protein [Candidatus Sulfotelmatobacter sp.]|jgi:hypothetical protein|nr:DUF1080 domain-containing protein [Candidatus Sulfotelmatobacter sp.]
MKSAALILLFAVNFCVASDVITPTQYTDLFNGKNFDGFTFCMKNDADPAATWIVTNGLIHCTGTPTGYLRTTQTYSNYVITVVWRFVKIAPKKDNTGVLVYMQLPDKVWPMCVQNQGKSGRQGDLFVMAGAECKEHLALGKDANTPVAFKGGPNEHAIGEWDTNTTVCAGNHVLAFINFKPLNQISECTISSGFIGIQSEGAEIEIKQIAIAPLLPAPNKPHMDPGLLDIMDARRHALEGVNNEPH